MTTVEQVFELYSAQEPEGWRVELLEGEVCVTSVNDGQHATMVAELCDQVTDSDRTVGCYTGIGLRVPRGASGPAGWAEGRLLPDLVIAPRGGFRNGFVWQDPAPVVLVCEVTSPLTAHRDRVRKIRAYARAGIPLYLLIDREAAEAVVCSEPADDDYGHKSIHKLGTVVPLPHPLGFDLDTGAF
jgi:Uma2 family endonuclease